MIEKTIQMLRQKQTQPCKYDPPSDSDILQAEMAIGTLFPLEYIELLQKGHDISVWTYKVNPNGYWDSTAHDIVHQNKWRKDSGRLDTSKHVLIQATGGDGGYDAFDVSGNYTKRPLTYPIVHLVYGTRGLKVTPISQSFDEWLRNQSE